MDDLTATIGDRIRAARQRLGWSQSQLAGQVDITPSAISQFEAGRKTPSTEMLLKIAKAMGVTTDFLMGAQDHTAMFLDEEVLSFFSDYEALSPRDRRIVRELAKALRAITIG